MNTDIQKQWYYIDDINTIDSPALVIYRQRVSENIKTAISMVDDVERLRPHVKTHKALEVTKMLMDAGILKFKCATIAEAEMLAIATAKDVLLAYQPVGPKLGRFIELIKKYPDTKFSCLVDNLESAKNIGVETEVNNIALPVYLDVNVGMNRTGIYPGDKAIKLYRECTQINGIEPKGFHVYDGHIRNTDIEARTAECDISFGPVLEMQNILKEEDLPEPAIIAGGSPTFPVHAARKNRECSPGTFVYWDKSYEQFEEQKFLPAALVISRVISFPSPTKLCLDLGHKSIAAENSLDKRVYFLNAPGLKFVSQSEEHLVAEVAAGHPYKIGDVLYGIPFHICPTVALYERALIIEKNKMVGKWKTIARDRKINI